MAIDVTFKSDPKVFDISGTERLFYRVLMQDSIFQTYPYAECVLQDRSGLIINDLGYTDKLKIELGLEVIAPNTTYPKLSHEFYVKEQGLISPDKANFIAPNLQFLMSSNSKKLDSVKSKSYQGNLSKVIDDNLGDFSFTSKRITTTQNIDYYYQPQINFMEFIRNNIHEAYSTTYPTSPFISFVNLNNRFHFNAVKELIETNVDTIAEFHLKADDTLLYDTELIRGLTGGNLGLDFTKSNVEYFNLDDTMSVVNETKDASDIMAGSGGNKFLLRKDELETKRLASNYGLIQDSPNDPVNFRKGWINSQYLNTWFPLRLTIVVQYPYLNRIVSGNNVKLTIEHPDPSILLSKMFSGQWLILESKHIKDSRDNLKSVLLLGKNTTGVQTDNKFFKDYL